jgi:hypothetical protein
VTCQLMAQHRDAWQHLTSVDRHGPARGRAFA